MLWLLQLQYVIIWTGLTTGYCLSQLQAVAGPGHAWTRLTGGLAGSLTSFNLSHVFLQTSSETPAVRYCKMRSSIYFSVIRNKTKQNISENSMSEWCENGRMRSAAESTLRNCLNLWLMGTHHMRGYKIVSKPASNTQQVRYISMLFGHESLLLSLSLFKPRSSRRIPLICLLVSCRSCEDVANIRQLHNLWVHGDKWVHSKNIHSNIPEF